MEDGRYIPDTLRHWYRCTRIIYGLQKITSTNILHDNKSARCELVNRCRGQGLHDIVVMKSNGVKLSLKALDEEKNTTTSLIKGRRDNFLFLE